jgi:hypothetical protein
MQATFSHEEVKWEKEYSEFQLKKGKRCIIFTVYCEDVMSKNVI